MADKMTRYAYQPAQTSMERHVVELVAHLESGVDSRGGFNQKIESAQAHAFWLENQVTELRAEVLRLEKYMMPMLPSVTCASEDVNFSDPMRYPRGGRCFDWRMETIRWRGVWHGYNAHEAAEPTLKRRTYRELLRLFRAEFEKTWTINKPKRRVA